MAAGDFFTFHHDQFVEVTRIPEANKYAEMKEVFVEKYGPPHRVFRYTEQMGFGAKFQKVDLIWEGPHVFVNLSDMVAGSILAALTTSQIGCPSGLLSPRRGSATRPRNGSLSCPPQSPSWQPVPIRFQLETKWGAGRTRTSNRSGRQ